MRVDFYYERNIKVTLMQRFGNESDETRNYCFYLPNRVLQLLLIDLLNSNLAQNQWSVTHLHVAMINIYSRLSGYQFNTDVLVRYK